MEQAKATTPTASTQRSQPGTFAHAHAVAGAITAQLAQDAMPFAVELDEDFPSGWRVHLKFRESRAAGLFGFAALVDAPLTRASNEFGVFLDAIARIENIEVRGSALLNPREMAQLDRHTMTPSDPAQGPQFEELPGAPEAADEETIVFQPVPLSASVLAQVPAVTPVEPATAEAKDTVGGGQ